MKENYIINVYGSMFDLNKGEMPVETIVCANSKICQAEQQKLYETLPEGCVFTVHRKVVNE